MPFVASFMVPHPPLIVPGVGRGSEKQVAKTIASYEKVADEIAAIKPETIVITSPHSVMYGDYFHISPGNRAVGSFSGFGAPSVTFDEEYDEELVNAICEIADTELFPCGTLGEKQKELDHGTMVPLWFIRGKYKGGKIVRIGLSGLHLVEHYRLGLIIAEAIEKLGRRAVFVASGDLSHKLQDYGPYGFAKEGPEYDDRIMDVMGSARFDELFDFSEDFCDKAAECGHRSFVIMAGIWDGKQVRAEVLSHEDVTGVGYGICTFRPEDGDDSERNFLEQYLTRAKQAETEKMAASDIYVRLARLSIERYVRERKRLSIPDDLYQLAKDGEDIDQLLNKKAGAFVSLHKYGSLRGCIGTILPTTGSIAQEIANNAIKAAVSDPRFDLVSEDELPFLEINVDVLGDPEDIESKEQLDVKRYGVIVSTSDGRRGLLLPDLEGVDTVDYQVAIAMQKGGISPDEKYYLQRFEVVRHT
ncbi:AmmeMemoRadiSam system protein A [Butyrivibrio sp. AE2032]|uniref:AmmeMemoRadiSam system protein A n=1 Tax=Butyrivibrio sp. AE2032 TaxID=1458463 RepID=UPI0005567EF9|nr:AmmeMemoRadiSam system protein A [Butyrivibrio sp. AE2032]